jgi:3-hydroxyisobutyrate dehydrogenase-like beta-hydroxyacid dehydrogenase
MSDTIVVIATGEMGAGIGKRLVERGARVVTSLKGRGAGSATRAKDAGMIDVADDNALVADADFVLSIVPPGQALALAERLKGPLARATRNPIYVDCNAVAPETAKEVGDVLSGVPIRFVDGGIIGGPPQGSYSPALYVSGDDADAAAKLNNYGLRTRPLDGPIGMASALKMSYGGLTKGFTAIGTAIMLGAMHSGCAEALVQELSESRPQDLAWLTRQVPSMFPKAYRWVAEMEEIASFLGHEDAAAHDVYLGIARLYERLASGQDGTSPAAKAELDLLRQFCALPVPAKTKSA